MEFDTEDQVLYLLIYLRGVNHQELESEMKNLGCVKLLYMCEECGASFHHTKNLNQHTSSKHGGIVYSCKLCAYKAKKPDNLKQHQDSVHGGKRFSCDQCIFYINILPLDSPPLPTWAKWAFLIWSDHPTPQTCLYNTCTLPMVFYLGQNAPDGTCDMYSQLVLQ